MATDGKTGQLRGLIDELPLSRLGDEVRNAAQAAGEKVISSAGERVNDMTGRLTEISDGGGTLKRAASEGAAAKAKGDSAVGGAVKGALGSVADKAKGALGNLTGGGSKSGDSTKATNIVESIDVGVPVSVAYNQWTQYDEWSSFMKKVERAEQDEDEPTVNFKAQVFWSHRTWEATIKEQVPDERIVWRSAGEKGHVDGSVTFHELAPNLTRILVVVEYYPQGFMEHTGNLWRAVGRRVRLELKHFRRHVMVNTVLEPDEVEGWRGEIHDSEVTQTHDEGVEDEAEDEAEYEDEPAEEEGEGEESAEYEEEPAEEEGEYEEEPAEEEEEYEEEPVDDEGEYEEEPSER